MFTAFQHIARQIGLIRVHNNVVATILGHHVKTPPSVGTPLATFADLFPGLKLPAETEGGVYVLPLPDAEPPTLMQVYPEDAALTSYTVLTIPVTPDMPDTVNEKVFDDLGALENIYSNLTVCDKDGIFTYASESSGEMYGVGPDTIVGRSAYELEKEGVFNPSVSLMVLRKNQPVTALQALPNGSHILINAFPIYDQFGEIESVLSFPWYMDDVTSIEEHFNELRIQTSQHRAQNAESKEAEIQFHSAQMERVVRLALKMARFEISVLLTGETGVGKTRLAKYIHSHSPWADGPFIEVNCAALPKELAESEFFGYEGGAFTGAKTKGKQGFFELANGGTLFLDEIGELPLEIQSKLLSVLQDKSFFRVGGSERVQSKFRLLAATNRDLQAFVKEGRFRSDLLYRINVVNIAIPPLRARPEDIRPLIKTFVEEANAAYGMNLRISTEGIRAMVRHDWPGNIRELHNTINRLAFMFEDEEEVQAQQIPGVQAHPDFTLSEGASWEEAKNALECHLIQKAYAKHGTSVAVGKALGISQSAAARKIRKHIKH